MIFGKPPFETKTAELTYKKIKSNEYTLPHNIDDDVHSIITTMLMGDADNRPSMTTVLDMDFFRNHTPTCLPNSILACPPRFETIQRHNTDINAMLKGLNLNAANDGQMLNLDNDNLTKLDKQITQLLQNTKIIPNTRNKTISTDLMADSEDPKLSPIFWITKWVDYSDRYGLGYQLNDNSSCVLFNDDSRMLGIANSANIQFVDNTGVEHIFTRDYYPEAFKKKVTLLDYFHNYMLENLATVNGSLYYTRYFNICFAV